MRFRFLSFVAITALLAVAGAASARSIVEITTKEGRPIAYPASANPTYEADPGVYQSGEIPVLAINGEPVLAVPLYGADPNADADPGLTWATVTPPGAKVSVYRPLILFLTYSSATRCHYLHFGYDSGYDYRMDGDYSTVEFGCGLLPEDLPQVLPPGVLPYDIVGQQLEPGYDYYARGSRYLATANSSSVQTPG